MLMDGDRCTCLIACLLATHVHGRLSLDGASLGLREKRMKAPVQDSHEALDLGKMVTAERFFCFCSVSRDF